DDSFGYRFPEQCPDGIGPCGVSRQAFELALSAEIPEVNLPLTQNEVPPVPVIMDLLEFCSASIGKPIEGSYHPYFQHSHLVWDREAGLASFVSDVNRLFARNGIAFELSA